VVDTPNFVAVGTNAALKAVDHSLADGLGLQLMFANTYHLLLQPGPEVVERAGGLHRFMRRDRPIITDSGGFQVFSLSNNSVTDELNRKKSAGKYRTNSVAKVSEAGVVFRSYRDGRLVELTPERAVRTQKALGADIIVPLDELPPYHIDRADLKRSVHLSHRWEARSLRTHLADVRRQAMYSVVHGGVDEGLRKLSAGYLASLPFDGHAIGGSLGKDVRELVGLLEHVMPLLPPHKPNHLLGIADEAAVLATIPLGIDTYDSCFPTRLGRHGTLLTKAGRLQIKSGKHRLDFRPLEEDCGCPVCRTHSRAYLHHLWKAKEPVVWTYLTLHNLQFMIDLMARLRADILHDRR